MRELVSNAVDASQKLKRLSSMGQVEDELGELLVEVKVDKEGKKLHIIDQGIGMSADEIKKYINEVAFSGAEEFIEKHKDLAALRVIKDLAQPEKSSSSNDNQ